MAEQIPNPNSQTITLKTVDNEVFEVEREVAMEFGTVKSYFEDDGVSEDTVMPLPNVSGASLAKVIAYCKKTMKLKTDGLSEEDEDEVKAMKKAFEKEFVKELSEQGLKDLLVAADFLAITDMLQFLLTSVANRIKNKSVEYVRNFFGIESNYTPEEEAQIRQEYDWAFVGVDED